jgi:hypothetical protein
MNSHPFAPGDRVVAVNTQEGPLKLLVPMDSRRFDLPDGPVRQGVVYHVSAVTRIKDGSAGVFITGLRCLWGNRDFPWAASRFRKVESVGHPFRMNRRGEVPCIRLTHQSRDEHHPGDGHFVSKLRPKN